MSKIARVRMPLALRVTERDSTTADTRRWAAGLPDGQHLSITGHDHVSTVTSAIFRAAALEFLLS